MTTPIDRAEINRRNAQKSTGPRTAEGKARSRFNAVKHGMRAKTAVLPGEDPTAFQARLDRWTADLKPADDVERFLVGRAVQLSWQLERADRAIADGSADAAEARLAERADEVEALGRRLFWNPRGPVAFYPQWEITLGPQERISWSGQADDPDDPPRLLNRLESSAIGCAWLLDRWADLRAILEAGHLWQPPDRFRAIRLLGRQPIDAMEDDRVKAIYQACAAMSPVKENEYNDVSWELHHNERVRFMERVDARGGPEGIPPDAEAGKAALLGLIAEEEGRLEGLLADHLGREGTSGSAFDASEAGERLRRYQQACDRGLLRVLEALRKRRREAEKAGRPSRGPARGPATDPTSRLAGLLNLVAAAKAAGATNQASDPLRRPAEAHAPAAASTEATAPAGSPPTPPAAPPAASNEANAPARPAGRDAPTVPIAVLTLLAGLLATGLAAALAAPSAAPASSRIAPGRSTVGPDPVFCMRWLRPPTGSRPTGSVVGGGSVPRPVGSADGAAADGGTPGPAAGWPLLPAEGCLTIARAPATVNRW